MIGREGGTIVGFLDVLKGVKETYDRKIEEERKRSAENLKGSYKVQR